MLPRAHTVSLFAALLVLCVVPSSVRAQEDQGYAIRPGDKVTLSLYTAAGEQVGVVSGERILDRDGDLYLPYVGTIHAAGENQTSLREMLVERFSAFYSQPVINVKVELRVNITGSVGRPGQYYLDPSATVVDALSAAGGAGQEFANFSGVVAADQGAVRLVRDAQTLVFSVRPDEVTPETLSMRVRSGDWIHVPPRTQSQVRDEVVFWSGVVGLAIQVITLAILIGR